MPLTIYFVVGSMTSTHSSTLWAISSGEYPFSTLSGNRPAIPPGGHRTCDRPSVSLTTYRLLHPSPIDQSIFIPLILIHLFHSFLVICDWAAVTWREQRHFLCCLFVLEKEKHETEIAAFFLFSWWLSLRREGGGEGEGGEKRVVKTRVHIRCQWGLLLTLVFTSFLPPHD